MVCVPTSLSQEVGAALGAQAGEAKLRAVIADGGFRNVRRATETPFNMILEARPYATRSLTRPTISDSVDCLSSSVGYYFTKFTSHLPSTVMK
jgi:hypothetical protein